MKALVCKIMEDIRALFFLFLQEGIILKLFSWAVELRGGQSANRESSSTARIRDLILSCENNHSKCHVHSVLCLGQAAPEADGVRCLKTQYYLSETSIPLLSITLNNKDFTPSDSISGAPSVSICSIGQINKYSLDWVFCLVLLIETETLTIKLV